MTHPNRRQSTRRKHEPRASIVKSARRADEFSYRLLWYAEIDLRVGGASAEAIVAVHAIYHTSRKKKSLCRRSAVV